MRRLVQAAAAAAALVALLAGLPAALWVLGRQWLPTDVPTLDQVRAVLNRLDDGSLFLGALVLIGFGAWVCLLAGFLLELPAQLAGRRPRLAPRGLRWSQQVAGGLLAAVLATALPAAAAVPAAAQPAVTISVAEQHPATGIPQAAPPPADRPAAEQQPTAATYVVQRGDTLWDIAERTLGDGARYPEIAAANRGVVQADGAVVDDAGDLRPGWRLRLPADAAPVAPAAEASPVAAEVVVVERGDTLSEIAAEEGLPGWRPIFDATVGRPQPAGGTLVDPDLILPGWVLTVPAPPIAAAPPEAAPEPPAEPAPAPPAPPVDSGGGYSGPQDLPVEPPPGPPVTDAPGSAGSAAEDRAVETTAGQEQDQPPVGLAVTLAGGGALLAAGIGAAWATARRRRGHRRRAGRAVAATPAGLVDTETAVLAAAVAGEADFAALDTALRGLSRAVAADPGGRLPDVVAARLASGRLGLRLHAPAAVDPPAPWTAAAEGLWWEADLAAAAAAADGNVALEVLAPYPGLVSVGVDADGQRWLLDLERMGSVQLTGPAARCEDLARHLVAELAVNSWSDLLYVTTVGFCSELGELSPHRLSYRDNAEAVAGELRHTLRGVAEVIAGDDVDVLQGRLRLISGDAWMPEVLVVAPHVGADDQALSGLSAAVTAAGGRCAVVVVTAAEQASAETGWQLQLHGDGQLRVPALDLELQAAQLSAEQGADIAALFAFEHHAGDAAIRPAAGDAAWQASSDAAGALLPTVTLPRAGDGHAAGRRVVGRSPWTPVPDSVLPQATDVYVAASATSAEELNTLAPRAPAELADAIEADLQGLDRDLADWWNPDTTRPRLSVLGPVVVRGQGSQKAVDRAGLRGRCEETIAFLAAKQRGVPAEELAEAVLHRRHDPAAADADPADGNPAEVAVDPTDVRASVYTVTAAARRWLGTDTETGQPHLSRAHGGRPYTLSGELYDAELFRQLRCRAGVRGPAGLRDLQAALELVTGPPYDRRVATFRWLDGLDGIYTAMICDVAHLVVTACLADGNTGAAREASAVAVMVAPEQEKVLLDAALVAFAEGADAEAEAHIARMVALAGGQDELDLWPDTAAALHRARTQSQQRRAS